MPTTTMIDGRLNENNKLAKLENNYKDLIQCNSYLYGLDQDQLRVDIERYENHLAQIEAVSKQHTMRGVKIFLASTAIALVTGIGISLTGVGAPIAQAVAIGIIGLGSLLAMYDGLCVGTYIRIEDEWRHKIVNARLAIYQLDQIRQNGNEMPNVELTSYQKSKRTLLAETMASERIYSSRSFGCSVWSWFSFCGNKSDSHAEERLLPQSKRDIGYGMR